MDKVKILCVDDEEGVLSFFRNICHLIIHLPVEIKVDIELATETSPLQALEILKNEKFTIFIIDYAMPGMNGIDLLKRIRQLYKKDSYISIFVTAVGTMDQFREEQKDLLFHYFLEKPINQSLAIAILKKAILGVRIRRNSRGEK